VKHTSYEAPHYACSLLQPPDTSSLLGPNILLSPVIKYPQSSSLSVRDQVSHPYKTTGKIKALYILIFMFLKRR
jgi:hypothetical protein